MNKRKFFLFCMLWEISLIASVAIATMFEGILFSVFYNVLYGLLFSMILPILLVLKEKGNISSIGIKKLGIKQIIVLGMFVLFSVGGQLIPLIAAGKEIRWNLLPICIAPLIMTTFFEEFLLRGFIQTRLEKHFGCLVAVGVSALMFSLYHLGYPGFRTIKDLLVLFAVGLGFAVSYKLSDNNLIVVYFVNLPNAFVTYMLKAEQFPVFNLGAVYYALITIVMIVIILVYTLPQIRKQSADLVDEI